MASAPPTRSSRLVLPEDIASGLRPRQAGDMAPRAERTASAPPTRLCCLAVMAAVVSRQCPPVRQPEVALFRTLAGLPKAMVPAGSSRADRLAVVAGVA